MWLNARRYTTKTFEVVTCSFCRPERVHCSRLSVPHVSYTIFVFITLAPGVRGAYNLWITQRVAPCGNRTRYPMRGSQLPSHRTNRAVEPCRRLLQRNMQCNTKRALHQCRVV
ncbi:hypothetical protein SFRURICE_006373 [Spodoptera frugiperda]|nr:hypothetical protein SFRURICE_006373 [Spodoptera frugiperda]